MPKGDSRSFAVLAVAFAAMGCGSVPDDCPTCGTIVVAAVGEPERLLPPLVWESVGRDIIDLVFDTAQVGASSFGSSLANREYMDGVNSAWFELIGEEDAVCGFPRTHGAADAGTGRV